MTYGRGVAEERHPTAGSPFRGALPEPYARFAELREDFLMDYGYNTARAYWGDLDDLLWWAVERDKDVLALTPADLKQYFALMRRRKYSENTIRRRLTAFRAFFKSLGAQDLPHGNPSDGLVVARNAARGQQ